MGKRVSVAADGSLGGLAAFGGQGEGGDDGDDDVQLGIVTISLG